MTPFIQTAICLHPDRDLVDLELMQADDQSYPDHVVISNVPIGLGTRPFGRYPAAAIFSTTPAGRSLRCQILVYSPTLANILANMIAYVNTSRNPSFALGATHLAGHQPCAIPDLQFFDNISASSCRPCSSLWIALRQFEDIHVTRDGPDNFNRMWRR